VAPKRRPPIDVNACLKWAGLARTIVAYRRGAAIFSQGETCESVMYVQQGAVKLSVVSETGPEAIVSMAGPGNFFGEGCLMGQPLRLGSATAMTPTVVLVIDKLRMVSLLHTEHDWSDQFIAYVLARNTRIKEDLIDQRFHSSEKRLARALLLLARHGQQDRPQGGISKISQETLADMIGATRSRVNLFMNKFKRLGFIDTDGGLRINLSLLSVVLDN
jgi:CRP/FNR family transcriptional regulator, cyclic AMP receptor protein